mgnify:CR=1 FL=1
MRAYEMTEEEFIDFYMYEQECIQMQLDQDYQEYRDMMNWDDEEEDEDYTEEELERMCERNIFDYKFEVY